MVRVLGGLPWFSCWVLFLLTVPRSDHRFANHHVCWAGLNDSSLWNIFFAFLNHTFLIQSPFCCCLMFISKVWTLQCSLGVTYVNILFFFFFFIAVRWVFKVVWCFLEGVVMEKNGDYVKLNFGLWTFFCLCFIKQCVFVLLFFHDTWCCFGSVFIHRLSECQSRNGVF